MSSRGEPHVEPEVDGLPGATSHPAIATVRAATQVLAEAMDEQALIRGICELVVQRGGYRFAWAGYVDGEGAAAISPVAHAGHEAGYLALADRQGDPQPGAAGPVATAVRTGHPQVVRSIADSESFQPWRDPALERGYRSCIVLPFGWSGEVYGALAIYSANADAFDGEEAALLTELADKVSAGVYFLRLEQSHRNTEETLRSEMEIQEALRRILTLSLKPVSVEQKLEGVLDVLFSIPWFQVEHQAPSSWPSPMRRSCAWPPDATCRRSCGNSVPAFRSGTVCAGGRPRRAIRSFGATWMRTITPGFPASTTTATTASRSSPKTGCWGS